MKLDKQCPKCNSLDVGYIEHQPDLRSDSRTAYKRVAGLGSERNDAVLGRTSIVKLGVLEAYVCTNCGYYESYVRDPQDVAWEEIAGFHRINPNVEPRGPFR